MLTACQPITIVAHQLYLCPSLPQVMGSAEFTDFCVTLNRLDVLLSAGVERDFVHRSLSYARRKRQMTYSEQMAYQRESQRALRCTVIRLLLQESLREFSCHLAESPFLQQFCRIGDLERVVIPGHSQLQRYHMEWVPADEMRQIVSALVKQFQGEEIAKASGLKKPIDLSTIWLDSTCAATNIHHPVDWLLLRDAVRTLTQAMLVLREHGVKHRMADPRTFQKAMNQLCIKMTHAGKGETRKQRQKAILREMKTLVGTVQAHAERHLALVDELTAPLGWAVASCRRMRLVLEQLPAVLRQAHERIIGERQVTSQEKILSLYEPDTAVLTRGKAGAQVEFGYSLMVAEQSEGLIVDWELCQQPQSDTKWLQEAIGRWQITYGKGTIKGVVTDRGFDGKGTRQALEKAGISNGMCPRSPRELSKRLAEQDFRDQQCRRSQTEGRIAIIKQTFLDGHLQTKGYNHHCIEIAWTILAHDLWVLARLPKANKQKVVYRDEIAA